MAQEMKWWKRPRTVKQPGYHAVAFFNEAAPLVYLTVITKQPLPPADWDTKNVEIMFGVQDFNTEGARTKDQLTALRQAMWQDLYEDPEAHLSTLLVSFIKHVTQG